MKIQLIFCSSVTVLTSSVIKSNYVRGERNCFGWETWCSTFRWPEKPNRICLRKLKSVFPSDIIGATFSQLVANLSSAFESFIFHIDVRRFTYSLSLCVAMHDSLPRGFGVVLLPNTWEVWVQIPEEHGAVKLVPNSRGSYRWGDPEQEAAKKEIYWRYVEEKNISPLSEMMCIKKTDKSQCIHPTSTAQEREIHPLLSAISLLSCLSFLCLCLDWSLAHVTAECCNASSVPGDSQQTSPPQEEEHHLLLPLLLLLQLKPTIIRIIF